jgi:hypothetical protein
MKTSMDGLKDSGFNHAFTVLVFCLVGWGLLESWLLAIRATPALHIALPLPALCIAAVSARRYRRDRKITGHSYPLPAQGSRSLNVKDIGWALFLLAAGGIMGISILGGSTVLLGAVAIGMSFIPWSRVPFCAGRVATSCLIIWTGAGVVLAIAHHAISLMFLPIATWVLWSCACVAVLRQVKQARRIESRPAVKALGAMHG